MLGKLQTSSQLLLKRNQPMHWTMCARASIVVVRPNWNGTKNVKLSIQSSKIQIYSSLQQYYLYLYKLKNTQG
jgi:hypothetical protein